MTFSKRQYDLSPQALAFRVIAEDLMESESTLPDGFRYCFLEHRNGRERGYVLSLGVLSAHDFHNLSIFFAENRNSDNFFIQGWTEEAAGAGLLETVTPIGSVPLGRMKERYYFAPYDYGKARFALLSMINEYIEEYRAFARKSKKP